MINNGAVVQRYAPLVCWVAVLLTAILICLKILGYGYLPPGDARRHVAKPFAHKPYSEIVVMRPQYVVDHSPGWEWFLGVVQRATHWDVDGLICFSFVLTALMILCVPLFWVRTPEAWMAALLAISIAYPNLMARWGQARPYLITEMVLMGLLFVWGHASDDEKPSWKRLVVTFLGFAFSVWMHGAWYLWILVPVAFVMARRWRAALWLTACWAAGTIAGALLTGKPMAFLYGAIFMAKCVFEEGAPKWMLVGEFQPSTGDVIGVALLAVVYLWLRSRNKGCQSLKTQPAFWMILICWTLGLSADRFWADWGLAAAMVWIAIQFDEFMPAFWQGQPVQRLVSCGFILGAFYLISTSDLDRRYTSYQAEVFLNGNDPKLAGWLPGDGGIFYADNMRFFYNTFYRNPQANWRYIVGFEPALMPVDDLKIYRDIQRQDGAIEAFEPWVKKMRPEDRLAFSSPTMPKLAGVEWKQAVGSLWIGRLAAAPNPLHRK